MSQQLNASDARAARKQARKALSKKAKQILRENKIPRSRKVENFREIPIAQARRFAQPKMSYRPRGSQNLELSGTDMFQLPSDENPKLHMTYTLPANPIYWKNTRISAIAAVYQKYRPIMLRMRYVPNCPATSSGSITMGFVEQEITFDESTAVQTILNGGGKNINIFQTDQIMFRPKIKDDLFTNGDMNQPTCNPFTFYMYTVRQSDVPPGIIYIDWQYEFKLGSGNQQMNVETKDSLTPENILMLQSHSTIYTNAQLKFGWGAVLGWLKTTGVKILKKIGVVVCQSVLGSLTDNMKSNALMSRTVPIREGQYLSIDPSDIYTSPSGYTRCKTSDGSDYFLPDTARVAIYMSGPNVSSPGPIEGDRSIIFDESTNITGVSKLSTQTKDGKKFYVAVSLVSTEYMDGELRIQTQSVLFMFDSDKNLIAVSGETGEHGQLSPNLIMPLQFIIVDNGTQLPFTFLSQAGNDSRGAAPYFGKYHLGSDNISSCWLKADKIWQNLYDAASDKTPWQ